MGIQIIDNFSISSPKFLDARQSYSTLAALQANTTVKMPKGLEVYVEDTAKWYVMSCTNADDPTTYTWTERPSGGGASLPDQTGHSGEFLTTNGTDASWGAAPVTSVNSKTGAVVLSASDVGALPDSTVIPAAQVNSDWNSVSGVSQILNKPSLATVATSGSYADLSHKPTIPTVNNPTITITQGGVTKGSFTLNQSSGETIALDAGGSDIDIPVYIDADIVGSLSVSSDGDVSGFDTNNYLRYPGVIDLSNATSFELVFSFTVNTTSAATCVLMKDKDKNNITIYGSKPSYNIKHTELHIWNNGIEYSCVGTTVIQNNTRYLIKVTWNGSTYTLYSSTDGTNYTSEGTISLSAAPEPGNFLINGYNFCSVHMKEFLFKKNGSPFWSGLAPVGLQQRAPKGHEIIEYQAPTSQNNYTWYRKYADGWVEQGGSAAAPGTINLPVEMSDGHYVVVITPLGTGAFASINAQSKTTTGFLLNNDRSWSMDWYVCGVAASA